MTRWFFSSISTLIFLSCVSFQASASQASPININAETSILSQKAEGANPQAIKLGLEAYEKAHQEGYDPQQLLTIVDYTKPSTEPRLFVFDLKDNNLLFQELVAHGKNSGGNVPTSFSDSPESLESSLGLYVTGDTYVGKHGVSLRLNGLDHGLNDMAAARDIVMHAADYVSEAFAREHGELGRSWGCFAVNPAVAGSLIQTLKDGSLIFAYYPSQALMSSVS